MSKWLPTLITLILLPILISLGFWQLDRAKFKEQLKRQYEKSTHLSPLSATEIQNKLNTDLNYHPVKLTGYFDNARTLLLDNQIHQKQRGYHILTPFHTDNPKLTFLVNRGWIPQGSDRTRFPEIPIISGKKTIHGYISLLPQKTFRLGNNIEPGKLPRVQQLEWTSIEKTVGYSLVPMVILRHLPPMELKIEMHRGYALQWFSLAGALVILYLVVMIRRK